MPKHKTPIIDHNDLVGGGTFLLHKKMANVYELE